MAPARVLVEDEAKDVVAEFIGAHLPPEGVGDVPQARLQIGGLAGHDWQDCVTGVLWGK